MGRGKWAFQGPSVLPAHEPQLLNLHQIPTVVAYRGEEVMACGSTAVQLGKEGVTVAE
jgi:hypothetical protein